MLLNYILHRFLRPHPLPNRPRSDIITLEQPLLVDVIQKPGTEGDGAPFATRQCKGESDAVLDSPAGVETEWCFAFVGWVEKAAAGYDDYAVCVCAALVESPGDGNM